jgi:hypothetical protein
MNQARNPFQETRVARPSVNKPKPDHHPDRYKQLLQCYQTRSAEREALELEVFQLDGRIHNTEQQLRDLPRWRRAAHSNLATQLADDRGQLDTARRHLEDLNSNSGPSRQISTTHGPSRPKAKPIRDARTSS